MYTRILVPLDGSATSQEGLRHAISLAAALPPDWRPRLVLLSVIDDFAPLVQMVSRPHGQAARDGMRRRADALLTLAREAAAKAGVEADTALREVTNQRIADVILQEARLLGCDLVVMGTHGLRAVSHGVLGSVADGVLRACPVPVLLVRHPEARCSVHPASLPAAEAPATLHERETP